MSKKKKRQLWGLYLLTEYAKGSDIIESAYRSARMYNQDPSKWREAVASYLGVDTDNVEQALKNWVLDRAISEALNQISTGEYPPKIFEALVLLVQERYGSNEQRTELPTVKIYLGDDSKSD